MDTTIASGNGAAIVTVNGDGTVNVWQVPQQTNIVVQNTRFFGNAVEVDSNVSKATGEIAIDTIISRDGAV